MRIFFSLQDKELIFCFGEVDVRLHINYKLAFLEYEVFYLSIQNIAFYELVTFIYIKFNIIHLRRIA